MAAGIIESIGLHLCGAEGVALPERVTFPVVGQEDAAEAHPELIQRVTGTGHAVGNHSGTRGHQEHRLANDGAERSCRRGPAHGACWQARR